MELGRPNYLKNAGETLHIIHNIFTLLTEFSHICINGKGKPFYLLENLKFNIRNTLVT